MAFNKDKVMDAARKFVDKGQIDKAVKEYLRIVHEDPKDVRVWLKIGDLYAKKGSKQEAIETYLKVARFYHDQGFFLKAVAVYKQILKLDPRLVDVILKLAELYRQLGLMSDAMQHFESVAAHFHREGNTKEALATVKKLVDLDPENIATRIKLAELYSKENLVDDAANEFATACEQLRRQGRQDDFVKVAERLLWHKPENHSLNRELAGLYLRRNDPRRALQKLQACFKADPRDVETLGLLAQAFQALDQKAKTVSVLKELARIHNENKQRDRANDVYRKILEFVPTDADAIAFLGPQASSGGPMQPMRGTAMPPPMPEPVHQQLVGAPPIPVPQPRPQGIASAPPIPRAHTPMPAPIRQATADVKFNITGDLPAIPTSARMTGSMPLVDEQSLSGDFALPEYDDHDFSADMEPPADPRAMSAAGEQHAEEISKILAETDVYVKYGLHQKAIDHLRRIFSLDPENVEAHERLKDIFVSQGREQEAETELLKLAETVASSDPDRAEAYLQELLAMNGTHTGAFELARRFRLRVARMSSVSSEVDYAAGLVHGGGGAGQVSAVDLDMDELELAAAPATASRGRSIGYAQHNSSDEFDADELVGMAHGSPTPQPRPTAPPGYQQQQQAYADDNFDLDFAPQSQATGQMNPDHALALASLDDDGDQIPVEVGGHNGWDHDAAAEDAIEAQLDDEALGEDIDSEVAAELAHQHDEDLPFDPEEARKFDTNLNKPPGDQHLTGYEATSLPQRVPAGHNDTTGSAHAAFDVESANELTVSGNFDPYITGALQGQPPSSPFGEATAAHAVDPALQSTGEATLEDELDEADFYAGQGMIAEALDILNRLAAQYPANRMIQTKLAELSGASNGAVEPIHAEPDNTEGTSAIDIDEIEEVDDFHEIDSRGPMAAGKHRGSRTGGVMLGQAVDESDADTHYDLGLAYKEMGLYDEAVKAFEKALRAPSREVQCRVMIGMCYRDQGNAAEAITQFKAGLHANPHEREQMSIYYEIAQTYESIGDDAEALYYFDSVMKRDPSFADCAARAEMLRARVARGGGRHDDDDI